MRVDTSLVQLSSAAAAKLQPQPVAKRSSSSPPRQIANVRVFAATEYNKLICHRLANYYFSRSAEELDWALLSSVQKRQSSVTLNRACSFIPPDVNSTVELRRVGLGESAIT